MRFTRTTNNFYTLFADAHSEYGEQTVVVQENDDEPVLQAIVRDFNVRNAINDAISSTMIARLDEERRDTLIHLDGNHLMRLCIPITDTFRDNMLLGLVSLDTFTFITCFKSISKLLTRITK